MGISSATYTLIFPLKPGLIQPIDAQGLSASLEHYERFLYAFSKWKTYLSMWIRLKLIGQYTLMMCFQSQTRCRASLGALHT